MEIILDDMLRAGLACGVGATASSVVNLFPLKVVAFCVEELDMVYVVSGHAVCICFFFYMATVAIIFLCHKEKKIHGSIVYQESI